MQLNKDTSARSIGSESTRRTASRPGLTSTESIVPDPAAYTLTPLEVKAVRAYQRDPMIARVVDYARDGAFLQNSLQKYGLRTTLTAWKAGVAQGEKEARGEAPPPGALKLATWDKLHGTAFILGRQHALKNAGMHGGTKSAASALMELLNEVRKSPEKFVRGLPPLS